MNIHGEVLPGGPRIRHLEASLRRESRLRPRWFEFHGTHCYNARSTCRHVGISPQPVWAKEKLATLLAEVGSGSSPG